MSLHVKQFLQAKKCSTPYSSALLSFSRPSVCVLIQLYRRDGGDFDGYFIYFCSDFSLIDMCMGV